jgi:hypothetical protein
MAPAPAVVHRDVICRERDMQDEVELLGVEGVEGVGGRSSVELDGLELECYPREVKVRCRVWREHTAVPCEVVFLGVLGLRVEELDFSAATGWARLVEVADSPWLADYRARDHSAKVGPEHRHLVLRTYDDVIEVLCRGYAIGLGEPVDATPVEGDA